MMPDDMYKLLFEAAWKSEKVNNAKVVACLSRRGIPLFYGMNQNKTHPFQKRFSKNKDAIFLHAETDVIKNALRECTLRELEKMDLHIMRVKRLGKGKPYVSGLACPCLGCRKAIVTFSINRVYYSQNESYEWGCLCSGLV